MDALDAMRFEHVGSRGLVAVVAVDVRVEPTGVDHQCDDLTSPARTLFDPLP
jgi:hypothetical protein